MTGLSARRRAKEALEKSDVRLRALGLLLLTLTLWVGSVIICESAFLAVDWSALHTRFPLLFRLARGGIYLCDGLCILLLCLPLTYGTVMALLETAEGKPCTLAAPFAVFSSRKAWRRALGRSLYLLSRTLCIALFGVGAVKAGLWLRQLLPVLLFLWIPVSFVLFFGLLLLLERTGGCLCLFYRFPEEKISVLHRRSLAATRSLRRCLGGVGLRLSFLPDTLLAPLTLFLLPLFHSVSVYLFSRCLYYQDGIILNETAPRGMEVSDMNEQKKFYMTTAIAYASSKPHIGNTYEIIMADAIARYRREMGYDVFLCTGTDEHGQKIENKAKDAGITPKEYVDNVAGVIKGVWDKMNTSYDHFIRTTDDYHEKAVKKIFTRFYKQGDIYKGHYEGWYCEPDESFFTETQVVDGKCPECGRPVKRASEEAYFFKMSNYADKLLQYIEDHPGFIEPESRKKEMVNNFLKAGLQDLCVSRTSFSWGIPVEFDPKHVTYVWLDALTNYITAIGYDPDKSFEEQSERFRRYWPADVHIIGKDILRFHTIYWPIFLMALGLPLPGKIFGHPWFNFGADKMSKSRGNVIYADELAERFTVDGVRYYALSEMPYNSDGSVTYENIIKRYNTDLVNNLGNLVKRTVDMQKKYFDGVVAAPVGGDALDGEVVAACVKAYETVVSCMDGYHVADALDAVFEMLSRANKYIDETTPWALAKDPANRARLGTVLYTLLAAIRWGAVLLKPFIPATAAEILATLRAENAGYGDIGTAAQFEGITVGAVLLDSKVLFARVDEAKLLAELEEERAAKVAAAQAPAEPEKPAVPEGIAKIGIDDFMKVELRTAQILACEPVPKAKKLLKLTVDLGYETRTVVSGIAKFYTPDALIGKKIVLVANLHPAVLCGVESNGMLLASGEETVRVIFLDPETPLGERIH